MLICLFRINQNQIFLPLCFNTFFTMKLNITCFIISWITKCLCFLVLICSCIGQIYVPPYLLFILLTLYLRLVQNMFIIIIMIKTHLLCLFMKHICWPVAQVHKMPTIGRYPLTVLMGAYLRNKIIFWLDHV